MIINPASSLYDIGVIKKDYFLVTMFGGKKTRKSREEGDQERSLEDPTGNLVPKPFMEMTYVFDFFVDLPHPAASFKNERAKIIQPPGELHPGIAELLDPSKLSRIAIFAFPDYEIEKDPGMFKKCKFVESKTSIPWTNVNHSHRRDKATKRRYPQ